GETEDYLVEIIDGEGECPYPTDIEIENVTSTSAEVSWTPAGDEDQWEVAYYDLFEPDDEETEVVDEPNITLTELIPNVAYGVKVRALCDNDNSNWLVSYFNTPCAEPVNLEVNEITQTSAEASWNPGNEEDEWEVIFAEGSFDPNDEDGEIV